MGTKTTYSHQILIDIDKAMIGERATSEHVNTSGYVKGVM